jgi:lipid A 4'-phosphatase
MKVIAVYGAIVAVSAALFLLFPGMDLSFSGLFYEPGHGFVLADSTLLRGLEATIPWMTWAIFGVAALGALWRVLAGRPLWRLDRKALIFIVAATAIGPGLIVNTVLKDHWGRARPYQIEAFGGAQHFTAAPLPADQCERNCSFVSGHAALAFSLMSFAFLLPTGGKRRIAIIAALGFGALIGLGRIAAGRHFLSDVVDAGLIVFGMTWLLHEWIVVREGLGRLSATFTARAAIWAAPVLGIEVIAMIWIDRPLAEYLHTHMTAAQPFFGIIQRFGAGYPYLILAALAFIVLRWGGELPLLQHRAAAMRSAAAIPGFLFLAVAASGLLVDLLKVVVGRARPKLLFAAGTYDFGWFGLRSDEWSFPSGHAATAAALMTALWCLWPRPLLFYIAAAALVAISRVVIGAHYLSDVIAGAVIAVIVTRAIASRLLPRRAVAITERNAARHYRPV